jgi:hypothetical protein
VISLKCTGVNGGFWGEGSALLAELTGLLLSRWGAGSDHGELELRDGQKEPPDKENITENRREMEDMSYLFFQNLWAAG